jgi:hypothetical protein
MVLQLEIVILQELHPLPLPHIQLPLIEKVSQAFMVAEYFKRDSVQIVPLDFQRKDYSG